MIDKLFFLLFRSFKVRLSQLLNLPIKPLFVNYAITYKCNSRCKMCGIWKKYQKFPKSVENELTKSDFGNFLKVNKEELSGVRHFGITGGEPFLRDDLVDFIYLVHHYLPKAKIGIQTNGLLPYLIEKKLKKIKEIYADIGIGISLDGIGEVHDQIRGISNAFKKFQKGAEIIKKLNIVDVSAGLTVQKANLNQIKAVKDYCQSLGFEFSCFLPDSSFYFGNEEQRLSLNKDGKREFIRILEDFGDNYYLDNLRRRLVGKDTTPLRCYSGVTSIFIDPYGDVYPCVLRSEKMGNIKDDNLRTILNSRQAEKIRSKLRDCRCWSQCEVSTSVLIDIFSVFKWFLLYADKKTFLKNILERINRF